MAMTKLGTKAVGSIVKIKENGTLVDFYVVKHDYESGLNGAGRTLVVRKDCYDTRVWHSPKMNAYASSAIDTWLNGTYKNLLDADIRGLIGTTQIRYTPGNGNNSVETLQRAVFLLSITELGHQSSEYNVEGSNLPIDNSIRIAHLNGKATDYWSRTPCVKYDHVFYLSSDNHAYRYTSTLVKGSRPAFTLPANLYVGDNGMVAKNTAPTTPGGISVPGSIKGGTTITVSWAASTDVEGNLEGYIVERSTNGGGWSQIYQARATSTTNTVAFGTVSVAYRVKAYDSEGLQSGYKTSGTVTVNNNRPPNTPGSISVPGSIKGGTTITVSWAAATDSESNLAGYVVERSTNGGGWSQIYKGSDTSTNNTVAFGTGSVAYRVKAYDSEGLQSGYKTSGTVTVNNNRPPNTPGSISVPGSIKGGTTITVSWAAATDAEGNLAGYVVERSTNGGGWSQIYKGSATSTSNAVAYGTVSVAYRVKAYDSEGLESGYKTSGTVTVHNNQAPSAPGSIKVTNVVQGENATVTITAATDPDGTVARYVYERSVDGGGWTKVKEINTLTLTDRIGTWTTVAYRAKAVDNEGASGPYVTAAQQNVNKPPTAPGSIKVTNVVQGENATVTITAATDPDGTVIRYEYERSVDGGGWTKLASVNALTLTDRIGEWAVVAYRARAVDNKETTGPFVTSAQQNVNKNWVYISGPSADMGSKPVPFNLTLSVNVSGQLSVEDINVNVLLDGAQVYSNTVPQGTSITVPIDTRIMRAGRHKIQVTATKSGYLSANKTYTFTVPSTVLPTGGYAQQLQDAQGQAIFPVTTARYVIGEGGQSVQAQLARLSDAIRGKNGHLEFVDALLGPVSDYKIARMRGAVYAATFFAPPGEPSVASVSIPANYTGDVGGVVTVTENELTIKLDAGAILNLYQYMVDTEEML